MRLRNISIFLVLTLALILSGCKVNVGPGGNPAPEVSGDAQEVYLGLDRGGYLPREFTVEAGKPVTLKNDGSLQGCALYMIQPQLKINANFAQNDEYTFVPEMKGTYTYSCSMGMWKGIMNVV